MSTENIFFTSLRIYGFVTHLARVSHNFAHTPGIACPQGGFWVNFAHFFLRISICHFEEFQVRRTLLFFCHFEERSD